MGSLRERAAEVSRRVERLSRNRMLSAWIRFRAGEEDEAMEFWERRSETRDADGLRALRSRTVVWHARAYDLEIAGERELAAEAWGHALSGWANLLAADGFAGCLREMSTVEDGVALENRDLAPVRRVLAEAVLSPHLSLAALAAARGDFDTASGHVRLVQESGFPEDVVEDRLRVLADRVCPIRHGEVTHTLFVDEAEAERDRHLAVFATENLAGSVHGRLEQLVLWTWRANKALFSRTDIADAWHELRAHQEAGLFRTVRDAAHDADAETRLLLEDRLREAANDACYVLNSLVIERHVACGEAIDRVNALDGHAKLTGLRAFRARANALREAAGAGSERICAQLCADHGEGPALASLRDTLRECRAFLDRTDEQARSLAIQLGGGGAPW